MFSVTVSLPGCLPVSDEPTTCDTLDEAKTALISELFLTASHEDLDVVSIEREIRLAHEMSSAGGCINLGGYAHEVHPNPND